MPKDGGRWFRGHRGPILNEEQRRLLEKLRSASPPIGPSEEFVSKQGHPSRPKRRGGRAGRGEE